MLELAIFSKEGLIQDFGASRRLAARIGMLLSKKIAVTTTVIEESSANKLVEKLLLSPEIKNTSDETLSSDIETLLEKDEYSILSEDFPLTVVPQDEWTVLALTEEIEAEKGFEKNITGDNQDSGNKLSLAELSQNKPAAKSNQAYGRAHVETSANNYIQNLRIAIFAGENSAERVSALRKLLFTDADENIKASIFLKAVSEDDPQLCAAAAVALKSIGLGSESSEAIRLIAEGDTEEKIYGIKRISNIINPNSTTLEKGACTMALLGVLRNENDKKITGSAITAIADISGIIDDFENIADEVTRLLIENAIGNLDILGGEVRYAFKAFEKHFPGKTSRYLLNDYRKTEDLDLKAFLLSCAISGDIPEEEKPEYFSAAIECLLAIQAESPISHMFGAFLTNNGEDALNVILQSLDKASIAHKRFLIRVLDNAVRFKNVPDKLKVELSDKAVGMLKTGSKQLINDIFESKLITPDKLDCEKRTKAADTICNTIRQFSLPQIFVNIENNLVRLGAATIPILVKHATEHTVNKSGEIACSAIGRIASENKITDTEHAEYLRESLRIMQKISFSTEKGIDNIYLAMGKVCSNNTIEGDVVELIDKNLSSRLKGTTEDAPIIESLGWICENKNTPVEHISRIAGIALSHLERADSKATVSQENIAGEEVFCFSGDMEIDAQLIPACINALEHAVLAQNANKEIRENTINGIIDRWQDCAEFKIQWSPGNVSKLTALLGKIGACNEIDHELKLKIVHTLAKKLSEMPILEALTRILASDRSLSEFNRLAAVIALRILNIIETEKDLTNEDREAYLSILGKLAKRGIFETRQGTSSELLSRVVDEIIIGARDGISGSLILLMNLKDQENIPENIRDNIEKNLKAYTSLEKSNH